ncbi:MAG: glycerate kinase [Opitutae bacterium]|nr:glycerate kinase [Opitutae bacterium]
MRVLIAFDKFKDALGARAACETAAAALRAKHPGWELDLCPLTDGGDGFCETLTADAGGDYREHRVAGPRGESVAARTGRVNVSQLRPAVRARLGLEGEGRLGVVELASASGLALLPPALRDPWHTATGGTGESLRAAAAGAEAILLGVGGSATNDLGLGALAALGLKFFDANGAAIAVPTPATWDRIVRIGGRVELPPLFIACDVNNPLLGPRGATATFGPQKGLPSDDLARLDAAMARMATMLCEACGKPLALADSPGAGAAGGIAFGLTVTCGAKLVPGFDLVSDWLDLPARLAAADLVLTGEGRFDATSLAGKGPGSLVREARRLGKPAFVFAGSLGVPADASFHAVTPPELALAEAMPRTAELLGAALRRVF